MGDITTGHAHSNVAHPTLFAGLEEVTDKHKALFTRRPYLAGNPGDEHHHPGTKGGSIRDVQPNSPEASDSPVNRLTAVGQSERAAGPHHPNTVVGVSG